MARKKRSVVVKFGDPPPPRQRIDWNDVADQLRDQPYEWGVIFENDLHSLAVSAMNNHVKAVRKALGFEFRTTDNKRAQPRTCTLWMRFNPDRVDPVAEALEQKRRADL